MKFAHNTYKSFIILVAAFCMVGCDRLANLESDLSPATATLNVNATIPSSASWGDDLDTKAVVTGTTPTHGFTFGLFSCKHEDTPQAFEPFGNNADYINLKAIYNSGEWSWSYEKSIKNTFNPLYFIAESSQDRIDFYAYSPWKNGVRFQEGFNFNVTDQEDIMWASYEGASGPTNRNCPIDKHNPINLSVQFHHALSRIVFHFVQEFGISGSGSSTIYDPSFDSHHNYISNITFEKSDNSSTNLYSSGNVNLMTGEVTSSDSDRDSSVYVKIGSTGSLFGTSYNSVDVLLFPVEYQNDDDFNIVFGFNTNTKLSYKLKKSDVTHEDGTVGFKPGYVYHMYFKFENYIRLDHVQINNNWMIGEENELQV